MGNWHIAKDIFGGGSTARRTGGSGNGSGIGGALWRRASRAKRLRGPRASPYRVDDLSDLNLLSKRADGDPNIGNSVPSVPTGRPQRSTSEMVDP